MILDISDREFINIMREDFMHLPKRWDGDDFYHTVNIDLFAKYKGKIRSLLTDTQFEIISQICDYIAKSIEYYFKGYPVKAYEEFSHAMDILIDNPVGVYQKSWREAFEGEDPLKLFRIRNVQNNTLYKRKDIFHTPYNLRSKVPSCRYSIAGYPSLYLGTTLVLCSEETKIDDLKDLRLAARFELVRNQNENGNNNIKVIELAMKPQDFISYDEVIDNRSNQEIRNESKRRFKEADLSNNQVRSNYICWYPLIAASSYIRVNKRAPFAAEYIIPQLLMQWIRTKSVHNELFGIRYFSCASEIASDMGFNYVFPVSGERHKRNLNYCAILAKTFKLTSPRFIHEYKTITECEFMLNKDRDLHVI